MTALAGAVLLALVLALLILAVRARSGGPERKSRPRELQNAELVYMETLFRVQRPLRLVARVDRVYRRPSGSLVLVELKRRGSNRVHRSDLIQLSVQKVAIEAQTGEAVDPVAFVSFADPGGKGVRRSESVRLLGAEDVAALARRREGILSGHTEPTYARSLKACSSCAFRAECDRFQ